MKAEDKEFLSFAVKLLFKRLEEGKVKLVSEKVPHLLEALKGVRFDESGEPIFETVTGPVRAAANVVFHTELNALDREAEERERNSPVHDFIGQPVDVSDEILKCCATDGTFAALAFELYRETVTVLTVTSNSYISSEQGGDALTRNQAICAALLVRIVKFMTAVMDLSAQVRRGEVVLALNRCILESATNLRFLLLKNEEKVFDQFVRFSLAPERELYDIIQRNVAARNGEVQPIERRMLDSIDRVCKASGIPIEEVDAKFRDWAGNLRNRLQALKQDDLYATTRISSHAVHGTWVDLLQRNLKEKGGGFEVESRFSPVDERLMLPICVIALDAGWSYIDFFFGDLPDVRPLRGRIEDLRVRTLKVDASSENWRASKPRTKKDSNPETTEGPNSSSELDPKTP